MTLSLILKPVFVIMSRFINALTKMVQDFVWKCALVVLMPDIVSEIAKAMFCAEEVDMMGKIIVLNLKSKIHKNLFMNKSLKLRQS